MASEQRLRDELTRAAESVQTDSDAALVRVVGMARRRQRIRRVTLAAVAAVVIVVGALGATHLDVYNLGRSPHPATHSTFPHGVNAPPNIHERARNALTGEWQSAVYSTRRVRAAITASGLRSVAADRALGASVEWRVQMRFSNTSGNAALVVETSDPSNPGVSLKISEQYLYRLLPGGKLLLTSTHPGTRWMFSYQKHGDRLLLNFLSSSPQPVDDTTKARFVSWTFAPLTLVH